MRIQPLKLMPVGSRIASKGAMPLQDGQKDFAQFLGDALGEVNGLQQKSAKAAYDLAAGKLQDVSQVTVAAEKATIALQLTMQIRNKVIDAYQEIMRTQV